MASRAGVYAIIHVPTGAAYIGGSDQCVSRFTWHRCVLRRGGHTSLELQRLWDATQESDWVFAILAFSHRGKASILRLEQHYLESWPSRILNEKKRADGVGHGLTRNHRLAISRAQKRIGADPKERVRRSIRAKRQHQEGRLGRQTWKNGEGRPRATYSPETAY